MTKILIADDEKDIIEFMTYNLEKEGYELFSFLFSKPGKVFTREELYERIWGDEVIVSERTLDVYIRKIRGKIGQNCIKTFKGVGYKFG